MKKVMVIKEPINTIKFDPYKKTPAGPKK